MEESRIQLYRDWVRVDKGTTPILFPPDLSDSGKGKLYRQLWYTYEGGARHLGTFLKKGWAKTPRRWKMILSLAFSEIIWGEVGKSYGPVNEWVEIAKKETGSTSGKVINGVLRAVVREIERGKLLLVECLPESLIKAWTSHESNSVEGLLDVLKGGSHLYWHSLDSSMNLDVEMGKILKWNDGECFHLHQGCDPKIILDSEEKGFFQNISAGESATQVARALSKEGVFLDYCAAPGGKSWQISKKCPNKEVAMYEFNPKRAKSLEENSLLGDFDKTKLLNEEDLVNGSFNEVLIDVPCSNSGVLVKSPEAIRHYWIPDDTFVSIQEELLEKAYELLGGKGSIFYSTCSIDKRENSARVQKFVSKHSAKIVFQIDWWPTIDGNHGAFLAQIKL